MDKDKALKIIDCDIDEKSYGLITSPAQGEMAAPHILSDEISSKADPDTIVLRWTRYYAYIWQFLYKQYTNFSHLIPPPFVLDTKSNPSIVYENEESYLMGAADYIFNALPDVDFRRMPTNYRITIYEKTINKYFFKKRLDNKVSLLTCIGYMCYFMLHETLHFCHTMAPMKELQLGNITEETYNALTKSIEEPNDFIHEIENEAMTYRILCEFLLGGIWLDGSPTPIRHGRYDEFKRRKDSEYDELSYVLDYIQLNIEELKAASKGDIDGVKKCYKTKTGIFEKQKQFWKDTGKPKIIRVY